MSIDSVERGPIDSSSILSLNRQGSLLVIHFARHFPSPLPPALSGKSVVVTLWGDLASEGPAAASLDDHAERRITLQITNCRVTEYNGESPLGQGGASAAWISLVARGCARAWSLGDGSIIFMVEI